MIVNLSLLTALIIQLLCQLFKIAFYSFKEKGLRWRYFFSAGGMPSSHSALVTALTLSLGLRGGLSSDIFAISSVFSIIIIYDSIRLRGVVQIHSQVLKKLSSRLPPEEQEQIPQMVGHTPLEVFAGISAGALFAAAVYFFL